MIKKGIKNLLSKAGYTVSKKQAFEKEFETIYRECTPFTMTSIQRMHSLYTAVNYVIDNSIEGDFVECGVWRGGSSMLMAKTLLSRGVSDKKLYLYDTFEGMPMPTQQDMDNSGNSAKDLMFKASSLNDKENSIWCLAGIDDVKKNLASCKYPENNIRYVQGKVEDTIPSVIPDKISILRLDTDWFESTHHELVHLFPILSKAGVLILDDYGYWQGARAATDQYFKELNIPIFLNVIDDTGRIAIKAI